MGLSLILAESEVISAVIRFVSLTHACSACHSSRVVVLNTFDITFEDSATAGCSWTTCPALSNRDHDTQPNKTPLCMRWLQPANYTAWATAAS